MSPPQIRFSAAGAAAIAYALDDPANPASSSAVLTTVGARGRPGRPRAIAGTQAILDLAFDGSSLELLTGSSPAGLACCSFAQTIRMTPSGSLSRPRTLVSGLTGSTLGRIVPVSGGGLLATIATQRGAWAAQAAKLGRFGSARRLTGAGDQPQTLAATSLAGGHTTIAWTATGGVPDGPVPRSISVSNGTRSRAPSGRTTAVTAPAGHQIEALQMASAGSVATVAWIETWIDGAGVYHSQPVAQDLVRHGRPHPFSVGSHAAAGLALASDAAGDQALAWEDCNAGGGCAVQATARTAGGRFGAPSSLGVIDASQTPAVTVAPGGQAFIGWVDSRGVMVASRAAKATRFGAPQLIAPATLAAGLTLAAAAPGGQVMAAWTQGTQSPTAMAATDRLR